MEKNEKLVGLRRGLRVMEILAVSPEGLKFKEVQDAFSDLAPSTVSRLMKVLIDEEMVVWEAGSKQYRLASRAGKLADLINGSASTAEKMQSVLDRLAVQTGLSAVFFEFRDNIIVIAAKSERPEAFHYGPVGGAPSHVNHGIRMICGAHLSAGDRKQLEVPVFSPKRFTLGQLRSLDVLVNDKDDQPGLTRIAAPVFSAQNRAFAGALGISFYQRFPKKKLNELAATVRLAAENAGL